MKKLFALLLVVGMGYCAYAQSVMSPVMRSCVKRASAKESISAFITADDVAVAELRKSGVVVESRIGDIAIVTGNRDAIAMASRVKGVRDMDMPGKVHLHVDSARSYTHASWLLQGQGMDMPYDGSGVVLGMIDCGIDYQHMAFKDANGKSRITRIYHPADKSGPGVMIDGERLQGREYTTAAEIAASVTDDRAMGHGTHTAGIAAGTTVGKYGGMAPGAELVMVGIPNSDLDMINVVRGVRYIATYAASVGKRCVINMSLGSHDGPHDGTGYLQQYMEDLNKRYGTIFVLSAGNEGNLPLYLHKVFSQTDNTLSTVMWTSAANSSEIYAYSRNDSPLGVSFGLYDSGAGSIKATSGVFTCDTVVDLGKIPGFETMMRGTVSVSQGVKLGKYNLIMINDAYPQALNAKLAFTIHGQAGGEVDVWDANNDANFSDCDLPGYSEGTGDGSYSDMATGDYCISVGAMAARETYPSNGYNYSTGYRIGSMASFSSYGTDVTGVVQPFINAPGVSVISSVSGLNCSKTTYSQRYSDGSAYHYWYKKSGTSMAAPCVSGIVALWLQACPEATLGQIKEAMAQTAKRYADGNPKRGANGDINAYEGLKYLIEHMSLTGDVDGDGVVDITDVNILVNIVLGDDVAYRYDGRADVSGDGSVDISDVNMIINIILNN